MRIFVLVANLALVAASPILAQGNYFSETLRITVDQAFPSPEARELAIKASTGNLDEVERIVRSGTPIEQKGSFSLTPLAWAVGAKNYLGVEKLLELGAEPSVSVDKIGSILSVAIGLKDKAIFGQLLKQGADPFQGSPQYRSAIIRAVLTDDSYYLEQILASGWDPNFYVEVNNLLDKVTRLQDFGKAILLLRAGADPMLTPKLALWVSSSLKEAKTNFANDPKYLLTVELASKKGLRLDDNVKN